MCLPRIFLYPKRLSMLFLYSSSSVCVCICHVQRVSSLLHCTSSVSTPWLLSSPLVPVVPLDKRSYCKFMLLESGQLLFPWPSLQLSSLFHCLGILPSLLLAPSLPLIPIHFLLPFAKVNVHVSLILLLSLYRMLVYLFYFVLLLVLFLLILFKFVSDVLSIPQ